MKNEDRILELLAEALQRLDRYAERFERNDERFKQVQQEIKTLREERQRHWKEQQSRWEEQLGLNRALLAKVQQHDQRLDNHSEAIGALRERTESMHQSSLEQVQAYRTMSQLWRLTTAP